MPPAQDLLCEACGDLVSLVHTAIRLRRLEWTTRYRPVHIQALLLSSIAPTVDNDFLYAPEGQYQGEAGALLDALEISREGQAADTVLPEFQTRGLLFIHVLGAPPQRSQKHSSQHLLEPQIPATLARIRRSL